MNAYQVSILQKDFYSGSTGTALEAFLDQWVAEHEIPIEKRPLAAIVDNRLRELTYPVSRDVHVEPITLEHRDGSRIYRRTLSFLLVVAIHECFPNAHVIIEHAVPSGGFFCTMRQRDNLSEAELKTVQERMQRYHRRKRTDHP